MLINNKILIFLRFFVYMVIFMGIFGSCKKKSSNNKGYVNFQEQYEYSKKIDKYIHERNGRIIEIDLDSLHRITLSPEVLIDANNTDSMFLAKPIDCVIKKDKLYILDEKLNELITCNRKGKIINILGRKGSGPGEFNSPVAVCKNDDLFAIYDGGNFRIQFFDKNLNFLSSFTTKSNEDMQYSFAYPTCVGISNQGDMYILDSDNSRILKFNLNGVFLQEIGNYDSGKFMLGNPKQFAISPDGEIFVINNGIIFVFDQYGNGLLKFKLPFTAKNINVTFNYLTITGSHQVYYANLNKHTIELSKFNLSKKMEIQINDSFIFNKKMYILSKHFIYVFSLNNSNK